MSVLGLSFVFLAAFGPIQPVPGLEAAENSGGAEIILAQSVSNPPDPGEDPDGGCRCDGEDDGDDDGDGDGGENEGKGSARLGMFGGGGHGSSDSASGGGAGASFKVGSVALAPSGAPEVMLAGDKAQIARAAEIVAALGGGLLRQKDLGGMAISTLAVDPAGRFSTARLQAALRDQGVKASVAYNTVYRQAGGPRLYAASLIGLDDRAGCTLPGSVRIGLIDGPVDAANADLRGVDLTVRSFLPDGQTPGDTGHATAIASLIASPPGGTAGAGLAIGARLHVASVFADEGKSDLAQVDAIAEAVDWLLQQRVQVIGLPFAGPRNDVLATILELTDARGVILVAPVGNDGQSYVRFPASDPHVISATAVDGRKRIYRRANRGNRVDFAAPGVDIYLPGPNGFSYRSGTSYAAGILTALVAREIAHGAGTRDAVVDRLRERSEDLGRAGPDDLFGRGLVMADGC